MPEDPPNPVAIVTGAGSGIGREAARLLAEAGHLVALVGRRREKLSETAGLIGPDRCLVVAADLGEPGAVERVVSATLDKWGRVDVLVNNAAVAELSPIDRTTPEMLAGLFAVNTYAPALLIARLWTTFAAQRRGCVINISSMSSIDPFPGLSVYGASKSALESLTRSTANEGRAHGIRAFSIAPGAVEAPMLRAFWSPAEIPESRTLAPADVATVIVDCVLGKREGELGQTIVLPS